MKVNPLTVMMLDRDRHRPLVEEIRDAGARTKMIMDGDVAGAIAAARSGTGVDAADGHRRHPRRHRGRMCHQVPRRRHPGPSVALERRREAEGARRRPRPRPRALHERPRHQRQLLLRSATGITDGDLLRGVRYAKGNVLTQSIVMRSKSGTIRFVEGEHQASKWESYARKS